MSHILRTAEKKTRNLPSTHLSVVNCALAGTLPAEAESLRPLQGKLNKSGSRRITARPSCDCVSGARWVCDGVFAALGVSLCVCRALGV